jgi:Cdc6-like AAA superfamily ATPase
LDLPLSKKTKTTASTIEKDIKTIEQHIELAKDSLTTDNIMDSHIFERDREFHQLKNCIANALVDRTGRGIYICGSPGGGKTLLVNQVLRNLKPDLVDLDMEEDGYDNDISTKQIYVLRSPIEKNIPFQIIQMTGTSILSANQFYSKLHAELEGDDSTNTSTTSTAKSNEMKSKVFQKFSNSQGKQSPKTPSSMIILVIDEIDRAPLDLIAELFTAAAANYSTLILVGIANDINFPEERLRGLPQTARPEPIIVFETYSIDQLKDILRRRLHNLADDGAINFLAAKSRKSGDVRTLIEMASKCVSFAENKLNTDGASMDIALEAPIINQKIVTMALKSLNGDPDIESLHKTSRNGILVLVSLLTSNDNNKTYSMSDMHSAYNTWSDQYHLPELCGDEFRVRFEELNNNGFLTPENLAGFGSRPMRTQQGKSQQSKYHLKVSASKLLKVLKEKGINMGVKDLENIVNKDKASYDDMGL